MPAPNLFLIYVTDIERATAFYADLFEISPVLTTRRYVPFEVAPGVLFAVWSGRSDLVTPQLVRTSEVGLMVPGVDEVYATWVAKGVTVVEEPHDEVFGTAPS